MLFNCHNLFQYQQKEFIKSTRLLHRHRCAYFSDPASIGCYKCMCYHCTGTLDGRITSLSANTELAHENSSLEENILELRQNYSQLLWEFQQLRSQFLDQCPSFIPSCSSLYPNCPSDFYQVRASNGSVVHAYCDMTLSCGGVTGGWMRVAELNMTDTSQQCPGELIEINDSLRRCETMNKGCSPITYPTQNSYTKVCGRITAYQVGSTNAFLQYYENADNININSTYMDGVSLTHGKP